MLGRYRIAASADQRGGGVIFGSVCSGIEAASVAWKPLGWRCAFMSEIERFPRAVLVHHYPDTPLHGDFTTIRAGDYEPIDLLVGGTPCQSFSVAGLRGGLEDERGNLALEYLRLADRLRPRWVVWENVPGVRSSGKGRDLGAFLGGLGELGYGWAYRSLDAQYFGLAQRRERVFVVGYLGDWRRAAAVLFEPASMRWDSPPRRQAGERVARPIAAGSPDGSGYRNDADTADNLIAHSLRAQSQPSHRADSETYVAMCLNAHPNRLDGESQTFIAHTLRADGFDASEDGTGRGTPLVPIPFDTTQITSAANYSNPKPGAPCHPLAAGAHAPAIAYGWQNSASQGDSASEHTTPTLDKSKVPAIGDRRLTPREAERLQGFPDDWTLIPSRKGLAPDGPRYKALGNSMAVPVMGWIGRRIAQSEAIG